MIHLPPIAMGEGVGESDGNVVALARRLWQYY